MALHGSTDVATSVVATGYIAAGAPLITVAPIADASCFIVVTISSALPKLCDISEERLKTYVLHIIFVKVIRLSELTRKK